MVNERQKQLYLNDPAFHALVNSMVSVSIDHGWSASYLTDAVEVAYVRIRQMRGQRRDDDPDLDKQLTGGNDATE